MRDLKFKKKKTFTGFSVAEEVSYKFVFEKD